MNRARAHRVWKGLPVGVRDSPTSILYREMYEREQRANVAKMQYATRVLIMCTRMGGVADAKVQPYLDDAEERMTEVLTEDAYTRRGEIRALRRHLDKMESAIREAERGARIQKAFTV